MNKNRKMKRKIAASVAVGMSVMMGVTPAFAANGTSNSEVYKEYYLDGKEMKPSELKGKSGHLKITVDYKNNEKKNVSVDGKDTEVCTPFVMMTGMILPNETFSNVTIDNGKIISDGNKNIVVGFGMLWMIWRMRHFS